MKIVTVIPELGVGGAEAVAAGLAIASVARGHEAIVASAPGFRVAEITAAGVHHLPLPPMERRVLRLAAAIQRLRRLSSPDLIHAHNPKAALLSRIAFGRRAPIITTLHGVADQEVRRATRILRATSQRVVVVSPHLRDQLVTHGFPAERIDVVPNGAPRPPAYPRARARAELGIRDDEVAALCPARMVDQKRHDLLLRAWASLPQGPVLLLAGDGPHRPAIERAIAAHGLGDRVRVLGERADMPRLLAAVDFVALATDWEGLPISIIEALGAGVPVVASNVRGIGDQFTGAIQLAAPGSSTALTLAVLEMVGDPALRRRLIDRGSALFEHRFAAQPMVERYHDLYLDLAGSPVRVHLTTGV